MMVEPNVIMANSNHSTGPSSSSSSSTSTSGDHKMVPAAIGSERKRHIPMPNMPGPTPTVNTSDWSSVSKRMFDIDSFLLKIFMVLFFSRVLSNRSISTAAAASSTIV